MVGNPSHHCQRLNILLRFFKLIHFFVACAINFGLERLELCYLLGIFSLGMAMLNFEIIRAVCLTLCHIVLLYLTGHEAVKVMDGSCGSKQLSAFGNLLIVAQKLIRTRIYSPRHQSKVQRYESISLIPGMPTGDLHDSGMSH